LETPSLAEHDNLPKRLEELQMVYLKIKREDIKWQWIYDISEVISIGYVDLGSFDPTEYGAQVIDVLNDGSGDPYVIIVCIKGEMKALAFYATEAYLCDQRSAFTIERLVR